MKKLIVILAALIPAIANAQFEIVAGTDPAPIIRTEVRKMPEVARTKDTVLPVPNFNYGIQSKKYSTSFGLDTILPAKMGSEPLQKLYRTYTKVGVGNYSSIMGEFNVMSVRSKNGAWGLHLGHWSAGSGPKDVAGEYAGYSAQNVDLFGKRFTKKHELSGNFGFNRDVVYNYGSIADSNVFTKDYTRQKYNFYNTEFGVKSFYADSEAVNHNVRFGYQHFDNRLGVTEDRVLLNANANRYIRTEMLDATFGIDYNRVSGLGDTSASTIVKFVPRFIAQGNKYLVHAGCGIYHETTLDGATHFFPQFYAQYDIVNHIIIPYVSYGGELTRNNYHSLAETNPFIASYNAVALRNTQRARALEVGLKGTLSAEVFYQVSASMYKLRNAPFFVNTGFTVDDPMQNKFDVVYDGADVLHVGGQIGWQKREKIKIIASGDWFQYSMDNELKPWHTPTLRMSLLASYNLEDKILVRSEIYYLNGQYARTGTAATGYGITNLKGLVDLNLGVEYRYNKYLSFYVDFRNIANQRYMRWNGYPTQKFNLMGGLTYTF
jgi:outer membrane receptor protein involved in Fe transport